jgi:leader peptidase (prepilin peptidase)/N-methyltransferase
MDLGSIMTVFSIMFGLIIGSFLNVCIYRIPLKKSLIHPPSSCPQCGKPIRFYDNIPVISYLLLLGKCRNCRASIPVRYPIVELIVSLLSLALFVRYGLSPMYFFSFLFVASLVTISFIDLHHKIIPDIISLPGILLGVIVSIFPFSQVSWLDSLIGAIGGGGFLFLVAVIFERITGKEGMGGGDVKLLAMIGAWMGWRSLPLSILLASLTGIIIGGGALLLSGRGYRVRIPFGPFLSLGALIYFFYGTELVTWYFRILLT